MNKNNKTEDLIRLSGADVNRCMKCGRCSASCPSYEDMDILPHQFVSFVDNARIDDLLTSTTLWKCLSCFTCVERCPRDVKPARLIEAARLMVIRQQGEDYLSPDEIPELLNSEVPQQLLVSAFRKYKK